MTNCSSSLVEYQLPAKLPEELRGRKLVGIGEVVHGSGGLHKLAGSHIQKMVTDFNVRIILFEAPQAAIAKINEHIVRGEPVPASLLSDLYFVWKSQDNLQLFNKLSELNRSLKEKVQIIGIDIRQPSVDLVQIREYLRGANKADLLESFPVKRAAVLEFAEYEKSVLNKKVRLADDLADSLTNVFEKIDIEIGADRTKSKAEKAQLALSIIKLKAWVKTYKFLGREGGYCHLLINEMKM